MTANKDFKRRVRERARRTGESYTAALRHLRSSDQPSEVPAMPWQRVEKTQFEYAVQIPQGWVEREVDLRNSPWETARFVDPSDRRHSVIVFRNLVGPQRDAAEVADRARAALTRSGFVDMELSEADLGSRPGVRLDCARHDAGRMWAVREYFTVNDGVSFCLGCGSAVPEEDESLFEAMARSFEILVG